MDPINELVEKRIREAMERGELDALPGAGEPLPLDEERLVPEELRVAYRLLKNAGLVPPEIATRKEIASAEALLAVATDPADRSSAFRRLELLRMRLAGTRSAGSRNIVVEQEYFEQLVAKLEKRE